MQIAITPKILVVIEFINLELLVVIPVYQIANLLIAMPLFRYSNYSYATSSKKQKVPVLPGLSLIFSQKK
jgi:hypothetical protein